MQPWYKIVTPRKEVREGRSFSPDEFAIALEQVVAGTAPSDYSDPEQFFSRTYFTRALTEHSGMILRRLSGKTENTAPVLTLMTQFGGGKTHTLTSLYHLAKAGKNVHALPNTSDLLCKAGISAGLDARVGVFVGNAWDPSEGRETPWIDLANQLAGDAGVAALGNAAPFTPPGTEALSNIFALANAPVLLLFDEVLNFVNRHRNMADSFYAFLQNLTVAITGTTYAAAVISLPRSQVEMTDWDQKWQDRIIKVVRRVSHDLIANDESEISEVVRRRLFEDLGSDQVRKRVARIYAKWCFERSARLPAEWTTVDTATKSSKAQDVIRNRFEACYPFHPATLSVFQQKWRALTQFQQTRGALAMLAQWISWASREQFRQARNEPLITLGSAPLHVPEFRAVILGQMGEPRLQAAIDADLAGETAHAKALDADTKDALRDIHRRVGTAILFESSGGQVDKVAHLPELRFALGEPDVETTNVDNAASALERKGFFIRKVGADGYRIHHQATLRKIVSDRRASLDEGKEVKPALRKVVEGEFSRGATIPIVYFPEDGNAVQDSPRLTLVILDPAEEWQENEQLEESIGRWTQKKGRSPRLYPGALVWCIKKPGHDLRERIELQLAWQRVAHELSQGVLGSEFDQTDRTEVQDSRRDAEAAAKNEVWAGYRYVVLRDTKTPHGIKVIDLGAGHSSSSETLCGRIITALKTGALLNESVGVGYIDRNWPRTFQKTGAWPLTSLRQSFLDGSLTRLIDPDKVLRQKIVEFVETGDFGLASVNKGDDQYERMWYKEQMRPEEVAFEPGVFLLKKDKAEEIRAPSGNKKQNQPEYTPSHNLGPEKTAGSPIGESDSTTKSAPKSSKKVTLRLTGDIPPEIWNKFGTRILPKINSPSRKNLRIGIDFSVSVDEASSKNLQRDLQQALDDLELEQVSVAIRRD